jgi:hypothetical protein
LKFAEVSADAFKTVGIDVHQLVGFEQPFDLRPVTGEQGVIFISAEIAESQMHHAWRRDFVIIRSEKSASLLTMTKSCLRANSHICESDGFRPALETGTRGSFGENRNRAGTFPSKR